MAASLGSLVVDISANVAKFSTDMAVVAQTAESTAKRIDDAFSSIKGLAIVAVAIEGFNVLKDSITGAIEAAAGLEQLSLRTGATVEGLANLSATARLSNTDNDQLAQGLQKLSKSMVDAANGGVKTSAAFAAIGLSTKDLVNLKPDEAFRLVAQRLNEYQDGAEKVAAAQLLMGKSGANLLPLLHDLADGGEIQSRVTAEQAKQAEEFEKNLTRLSVTFHENANALVQQFLPALSSLSENMLAAQKAGAGLLQTLISIPLGNLAAAIAGTGIQERIDSIRASIKSLEDAAAHPYPGQTAEGLASIQRQAIAAKAALAGLLAQQRATALAGAEDYSDQVTRQQQPKVKPTIDIKSGKTGSLGAEEKAARDAAIKDLDRSIASENAILSQREQFLTRYYSQDQITLEDYFAKRASAIQDNLQTVQADYAKEIAAAQLFVRQLADAQKKAPTGGPEETRIAAERIAAQEKVLELQDKSAKAASAAGLALINNSLDGQQAALKQKESIEALNIQLLQMTGHLQEAAAAQAVLSREQIPQRKLGPEGDVTAARVIALNQINSNIAAKQRDIGILEGQASLVEQRIALQEQTGSIGQLEGLQKLGEARRQEIADLEKLVTEYEALAAASGTPEALLAADQLRLRLEQLKAVADPLAQKFQDMFQTAFSDQFAKVIQGTEGIRQAFANMATGIITELSKIASQDIAKQIFGGSGGAGTGLFGAIGSFFQGGNQPAGGVGPVQQSGFASLLASVAGIFGKQSGGPVTAGSAYLVGERGPELFAPGSSGTIIPGGRYGNSTIVNVHMPAGVPITRESATMVGALAARQIGVAHRRNN
jgi:hypothetical protein